MSKNLNSKCKQCRREGEKLFLKGERCYTAKCAIVKRNYPPGLHGAKGRPRQSEYSLQLREKQKAKKIYNLLEKQFKLTFIKAHQQKGESGENFIRLLETRLDNVIYRLGLASSRSQARQLVNHNHFTVNKNMVNIPSYVLKTGDVIAIKSASQKNKNFLNLSEKIKKHQTPGWINFDLTNLTAKILHQPKKEDGEKINTQLIVEFYSR